MFNSGGINHEHAAVLLLAGWSYSMAKHVDRSGQKLSGYGRQLAQVLQLSQQLW